MFDHNSLGYSIIWIKKVPELNCIATLYTHDKTNAEVLVLKNEDENKMFSISFKTLPKDSTGVAHILEHSVLNGSKKYSIKEPFVELIKTSLNTFLNAMTWPDKTIYPICSVNEKDFDNLMDVYLDAVFNPLITQNVFEQEGWHYELKNAKDPVIYKGVVFNEMKGSMSNPESIIENYVAQELFPGTLYSHNSGGDPDKIPNLTYEDFRNFHKTYYHPSNSKIVFYGNIDEAKCFKKINEFIDSYEYAPLEKSIQSQPKFSSTHLAQKLYPASEESKDKGYAVSGWSIIGELSQDDRFGLEILNYILLGSEASPLKKALMESRLGEGLIGLGLDQEYLSPVFYTGLKGVKLENIEKIEQIIQKTLIELSKQIDNTIIEGAINRIEFNKREGNPHDRYPKNIYYLRKIMETWNYDLDPLINITFEESFKRIRGKISTGEMFFENLIKKYFLDNTHHIILIVKPDLGFTIKNEEAEKTRLEVYKANLGEDGVQKLLERNKDFEKWQKTKDTPEALKCIPQLEIKDISSKPEILPIDVSKTNQIQIIKHDIEANKVSYLDIGINITDIDEQKLSSLSIFANLLGKLDTRKRSFSELATNLDKNTGGFGSRFLIQNKYETNETAAYMFFSIKFLDDNLDIALQLLNEILSETKFGNKDRIKQLLDEDKSELENRIINSGHSYAISRSISKLSADFQLKENISGIKYYELLKDLIENFEVRINDLVVNLENFRDNIISSRIEIVNYTGRIPDINKKLDDFCNVRPSIEIAAAKMSSNISIEQKSEAFIVPTSVNYVAQAFSLYKAGYQLHGSFYVVNQITYGEYLWQNIRAQGGAYGGMNRFDLRNGIYGYVSYRDPNLSRSINVYNEAGEYFEKLEISPRELEGNIIGCIGDLDNYMTPEEKGWLSMERYLTGITDELRKRLRSELLGAKLEDIRKFGSLLKSIKPEDKVNAVVGNKERIESEKDNIKFDTYRELF